MRGTTRSWVTTPRPAPRGRSEGRKRSPKSRTTLPVPPRRLVTTTAPSRPSQNPSWATPREPRAMVSWPVATTQNPSSTPPQTMPLTQPIAAAPSAHRGRAAGGASSVTAPGYGTVATLPGRSDRDVGAATVARGRDLHVEERSYRGSAVLAGPATRHGESVGVVGAEIVSMGVVLVVEVVEPGAAARVVVRERGRRGARAHRPVTAAGVVGGHRPTVTTDAGGGADEPGEDMGRRREPIDDRPPLPWVHESPGARPPRGAQRPLRRSSR